MKPVYTAVLLIPTGIGAAIGGFAGDALPVARALAAAVDCLVTHPNVLNGASCFWPIPNALYVEGFGLDQWCRGLWQLRPVRQNRVGVILDAALEPDLRLRHYHVIQAARATLGLAIGDPEITPLPVGVRVSRAPSGASQGSLERPEVLLATAKHLLARGYQALAVVTRFPDDLDDAAYNQGQGVDPLAGLEAIISHLLVQELGIPCAHAPALRLGDPEPVAERVAAEWVGFTFLPSVLVGLSYAPQFVRQGEERPGDLRAEQVDVVITPASACGNAAILHLMHRSQPPLLISVADNSTLMHATAQDLGIPSVVVRSYWEAIGWVVAHRAGVYIG
ncbi:MAG: DUF3326 domain-containing protein [Thermostichales cyanobacterium SRBZ-1_bins_19]